MWRKYTHSLSLFGHKETVHLEGLTTCKCFIAYTSAEGSLMIVESVSTEIYYKHLINIGVICSMS